jgi:uncharacterized protein YegJ (DUF2314 family)
MNRIGSALIALGVGLCLGCSKQVPSATLPASVEDLPRLTGKVTFQLEDGEAYHRAAPATFQIPERERREKVKEGEIVKLIFRFHGANDTRVERMWVKVSKRLENGYLGILDNDPYCTDQVKAGIEVSFQPQHIINIWVDEAHPDVMEARRTHEEGKGK